MRMAIVDDGEDDDKKRQSARQLIMMNKNQAVGLVDASPRAPRHRPHGRVVTR